MDYLKIDAARRYARTLANEAKLNVRFHDQPGRFWAEGRTINIPDPLTDNDLTIWMYGLIHEIQHHSPEYRKFMYENKDPNRHILNNNIADYQQEVGLSGRYEGKDRMVQAGRSRFLADIAAQEDNVGPPENDMEMLSRSLFTALDKLREEEWSMFTPTYVKNPQVLAQADDILAKFGDRLRNSVTHDLDTHKQLIEDLIHTYIKDNSAAPTPEQGAAEQAELEAKAAAGDQEAQAKLEKQGNLAKKIQKVAGSVDSHEKQQNRGEAVSTYDAHYEVHDWQGNYSHQLNIPNISEQVRKLLMAKKQKHYEGSKMKGKFRGNGVTRLVNKELNVFSQKQQAMDVNTDIMVMVDISSSMSGSKMVAARDGCAGFATVLQDLQANYGILAFGSNLHWVKKINTKSNSHDVLNKVASLDTAGGTTMMNGIVEASQSLLATRNRNKTLVLITDGEPTDALRNNYLRFEGTDDPTEVLKNVQAAGINTYTILIRMPQHVRKWQASKLKVANIMQSDELPSAMIEIIREIYE